MVQTPEPCILNDRSLTCRSQMPPDKPPIRKAQQGFGAGRPVPAKPPLAARHPRRHPPARGARPGPAHPPRPRTALRRLEGPRRRPDDGLRSRPDRAPADPAARRAPAPAPAAPGPGRLLRRGAAARSADGRDPPRTAHRDPGSGSHRGARGAPVGPACPRACRSSPAGSRCATRARPRLSGDCSRWPRR